MEQKISVESSYLLQTIYIQNKQKFEINFFRRHLPQSSAIDFYKTTIMIETFFKNSFHAIGYLNIRVLLIIPHKVEINGLISEQR